jgi:1,4-dihydroxy-2-naphthoate octaprenyltransferase
MLKDYLNEAVEPALVFAPLCALLGIIASGAYHKISITTAVLLVVGVLFAQMSVNVLNDYVDYRKGIDADTTATKFSGGKKLIVEGRVTPKAALLISMAAFAVAAVIGLHFALSVPAVIPFIIIGAISILLYTSCFLYAPFIAEPMVVVNFMLIGFASFIVASSSTAHMATAFLASFPAGAVIGMALLINEMPDRKVDAAHGRKSGAVMLGSNSNNAYYYLAWQIAGYASIIIGVLYKLLPYTELVALVSVPLMAVCVKGMRNYSKPAKFEKYMGINAIYCIVFICLLIAGYAIAVV